MSLLDDPAGQNTPAVVQAVHDVAREQPAALCRPAGQSAQALHLLGVWYEPGVQGQCDRPVSYCPAPHPVFPWKEEHHMGEQAASG